MISRHKGKWDTTTAECQRGILLSLPGWLQRPARLPKLQLMAEDKTHLQPHISTPRPHQGPFPSIQIPASNSKPLNLILCGRPPGLELLVWVTSNTPCPGLLRVPDRLPVQEPKRTSLWRPGANQAGAWHNIPSRGHCWLKVSPCVLAVRFPS